MNVSQVWRNLKTDWKLLIVDEAKILESLCYRYIFNIVERGQNKLHIFKHAKSCFPSVYQQLGSYDNIGRSSNKNGLLM